MRKLVETLVIAGAAFAPSCSSAAETLSFPTKVLESHLIGSIEPVHLSGEDEFYFDGANVDITVGPDGSVTDVTVHDLRGNAVQSPQVRDRALGLHFRPFVYRDRAVKAVGTIQIPVSPPEVWADARAPFPPVGLNNVEITLRRSACFGTCPAYQVTISGGGEMRFFSPPPAASAAAELFREHSMDSGVIAPGVHVGKVDAATVQRLVDAFRSAHFFGLKSDYSAQITDNPTHVLRFRAGSRAMEVNDYVGGLVGMPPVVTTLEKAVDEAADTNRWTSGDSGTVPALLAAGMRIDSPDAIALAANATRADGGEIVLIDLIAAGLPLERMVKGPDGTSIALGKLLMLHSVKAGRPRLAGKLIAAGWLKAIGKDELGRIFASGAGGCSADLAQRLVAAGADAKAHALSTGSPGYPDGGGTALISALEEYGTCRDLSEPARLALVRALLHLGADVNAVDANGRSALFYRDVPEEQALLLRAGANVNLRARNGETPIFDTGSDSEALPLLAAGADPRGKDANGKSLRQLARERNMPATLEWLDRHSIK